MEQDKSTDSGASKRINPPGEAWASTFFNGVSNGIMLGAAPSILLTLFDEMRGKKLTELQHQSRGKWGLAMTATGCVLGAVFGGKEAARLQRYRHEISDRLAEVEGRVDAQSADLKDWREKATASKAADISKTLA